jgi:hypothetical protein
LNVIKIIDVNYKTILIHCVIFFFSFLIQGEGGKVRRAPSWRKKFRGKDSKSGEAGEATAAGAIPNPPETYAHSSPHHLHRSAVLASAMVVQTSSTGTTTASVLLPSSPSSGAATNCSQLSPRAMADIDKSK